MLTTTPTALLLIKAWEGLRTSAYFDSVGVPTIGFGTTKYANGDEVMPGDEITEDEAEAELFHYIRNEVEQTLNQHFEDIPLQPNQRDALASFIYNLGGDASKWNTLKRLIRDPNTAPERIADQWMIYHNAGGKALLGLYRRRMAEVLVWMGLGWKVATDAAQTAKLGDDWRQHMPEETRTEYSYDEDVFEETIKDPTPEDGWTTKDLNIASAESLKTGLPIDYGVPMTKLTKKTPVESVHYLADADKKPGNITVKPIEDSQRGKGYAKSEMGKQGMIAGAGGSAAVAIGAAEPVVKFVDKYPSNTIAAVFLLLLVMGVGLHFYGKWQRERGEDSAEDLLG